MAKRKTSRKPKVAAAAKKKAVPVAKLFLSKQTIRDLQTIVGEARRERQSKRVCWA